MPRFAGRCAFFGTLNHIYIDQRQDVEKGRDFGTAGPYERIVATVVYEPEIKVDIEYVKPRNPAKGNGAVVLLTGKSRNAEPLWERGYSVLLIRYCS